MNDTHIENALLDWNEQGTPVSREFDDVYFSNQNGLEETRYVFLNGNQIPARFVCHQRDNFTIAETGFGTGLNFLTLWHAFRQFRQQYPQAKLQRLHFISFEKFPLKREDLSNVHHSWPEFQQLSAQLQQQWPLALPGCQRLLLDNEMVTLDLWFGDVNLLLPALDSTINRKVDAWFLDGFAPSKNPDMWTPLLFRHMAKLAAVNGTFATFTAAGFVRRGLQDAGFEVSKIKGFGHKRNMLTGILPAESAAPEPSASPWFARPAAKDRSDIAIIGGGISSAMLALSLLRRGAKVTLYCADSLPAQSASGNAQGVLYPLLSAEEPLLNQFFMQAFTFARRTYDSLLDHHITFDHQWCGVSQLGYNAKNSHKNAEIVTLVNNPKIVHHQSQQRLEQACGLPTGCEGIHYPMGGWLSPSQLTEKVIKQAQSQGLVIHYQHQLTLLTPTTSGWQLDFEHGHSAFHPTVVLANGHNAIDFLQTEKLPLSPVRGQVTQVPASSLSTRLKQVLCYDGYITPADSQQQFHCLGASYCREERDTEYKQAEQQDNLNRLINCLPNTPWPKELDISGKLARVSVRSSIRDHFPMIGAVPDYPHLLEVYHGLDAKIRNQQPLGNAPIWPELYIIAGLGSRGLCTAPLLAETLAGQIFGEPLPLSEDILAALSPNRIWTRRLLRGRPVN